MIKKMILVLLLIGLFTGLAAQNVPPMLNILLSSGAYFPKYSDYHFKSPLYNLTVDGDFLNLYLNYGFGGSMFYTLKSYDEHFDKITFYDLYLHNITKTEDKESSFAYGFYLGFRRTDLEYIEKDSDVKVDSYFVRPIIGMKYSSNSWGSEIAWTMNEREKSRFEYALKFRNNQGWWLSLGGSSRGFIKGSDADLHISLGYQLELGY